MDMETEGKTLETSASPCHQITNGEGQTDQTQKISDYEQSREERIKENLQRMQKLGIVDLSLQVKSFLTPKRAPKNSSNRKPLRPSPLPPSEPPRRSSRLQNVTPVSYSEEPILKRKRSSEDEGIFLKEGPKPEFYTEEQEELLGSTERSWELFVDGCGNDGKRIYDSIKGKTCHQCRQKTLGLRTHCSQCNMVQGQFCGDCLYMRYGEHVLESNENPNWICPVCRGICNCSLCRTAKGWPPTGPLYKKITKLGFRSVAHYLIQTRRSQTNIEKDQGSQRSLPFPDMSLPPESKESPEVNDDHIESPLAENEESPKVFDDHIGLPLAENEEFPKADKVQLGLPKPQSEDKKVDEHNSEKENDVHFSDDKHDNSITLESSPKVKRKPAFATGPSPDSISLRLRQRKHNKSYVQSSKKSEEALDLKQVASNVCPESKSEFSLGHPASTTPSSDSIAGRLRSRRKTT